MSVGVCAYSPKKHILGQVIMLDKRPKLKIGVPVQLIGA